MAYDLRFLPEYCCGVAIGTASPTMSETYALGSIKYGNDYVTLNTDKKKYEFYAARPLTFVNLCKVPFTSGASAAYKLWFTGTRAESLTVYGDIYWRVSSDGVNWSSWYSHRPIKQYVGSSEVVDSFYFTWTQSNVNYIQFGSTSNFSWSEGPQSGCQFYLGCNDNWRIAVEGNINSMLGQRDTVSSTSTVSVGPFALRGMLRGGSNLTAAAAGTWSSIMFAHNLVHNCSQTTGRQCYTYFLAVQTNLLTAPLYWNVYSRSTAYSTSYNQIFRGFCDGCTSLLTGLRNYKGWSGDCAYLYRNCTNLRFIFKCFGASSSNMVQNVPTAKQWNSSPAKNRVVQTVSMGSGSGSYPSMSNWTAHDTSYYWGKNQSTDTNYCFLPSDAMPVAENE